MKFGVVTFPGSNCDNDMIYVLQEILGQKVVRLWHKDTDLQGVDFVVLPGGFSYGDYLRSGAIAKLSPIMEEVIQHAGKGGYVLGICNGFQVLTESGLLEGALLHNTNQRFICKNSYLKPEGNNSILTKKIAIDRVYTIPIAHGEGRFFASDDTIKSLEDNNQILFRYVTKKGEVTPESNPNGSIGNIVGIQSKKGNVMGMMPHPERASDPYLGNTDGKLLLDSILNSIS